MKADTIDLAAIFGQPVRYLVPLFQRPYVWKKDTEWVPLWEDIRAVLERQLDENPNNNSIPHFLGRGRSGSGSDANRDGPGSLCNRWTAAADDIAAVHRCREVTRSRARPGGPFADAGQAALQRRVSAQAARGPVQGCADVFDRPSFQAAVDSTGMVPQSRMLEAFEFFRESVGEWALVGQSEHEIAQRFQVLSTVLWKLLVVVAIDLEERDNAQVIFETLNARGTPLLAADLIKNHLFQMAIANGLDVDDLYHRYWQPLDQEWWRTEVQQGRLKRPRLDSFMNHWLSMRLGEEVVVHQLFPAFKRHVADQADHVEELLAELAQYAVVYESFERRQGEESRLGRFLYRIKVMEVTTSYPLLLWLFGPNGMADTDERLTAMDAIESWLVRRVILRGNTQGYTTIFVSLLNSLRKTGNPAASRIVEYLRGLEGERGYWPSDAQLRDAFVAAPMYNVITRARLRMVLEAIEERMRAAFR